MKSSHLWKINEQQNIMLNYFNILYITFLTTFCFIFTLTSFYLMRSLAMVVKAITTQRFLIHTKINFFLILFFWLSFLPLLYTYQYLTTCWGYSHTWWRSMSEPLILHQYKSFMSFELMITQKIVFTFLVDELSIFFSLMSILISMFLFSLLYLTNVAKKKQMYLYLIYLEYVLIMVFLSNDVLSFFISFELTLIPMYLLIIFFGTGQNTHKASFWFLIFTLLSSIFLFIPIAILYSGLGLTSFADIHHHFWTSNYHFDNYLAKLLCVMLLFSFIIKIPLMPLHIWLPEVHVEAPTFGSMVLASLLLKLGGYGIIRLCMGLFPTIFNDVICYIIPLILISMLTSAAIASIQTDIKKIVAYSSISHMSVALLGLVFYNSYGLEGSLVGMFAHSFTAPALFFIVGILYERYHTRNLLYYGGLSRYMPLFTFFFFMYILSNIAFPGSLNFIGELYIILGFTSIFYNSSIFYVLLLIGLVCVSSYNLLLFSKICWGNINTKTITTVYDVSATESSFLVSILIFLYFLGFEPELVLSIARGSNVICFY